MTDVDVARMDAFIRLEIDAAADLRAVRVASLWQDCEIFIAGADFATASIFLS